LVVFSGKRAALSSTAADQRQVAAAKRDAPAHGRLPPSGRGKQGIDLFAQTGNPARGIFFVNGTFDRGLLDDRDSGPQGLLRLIGGLVFNGLDDLFDGALHFAFVGAIAEPLLLALPVPLDGGLMISQFSTPVNCVFCLML